MQEKLVFQVTGQLSGFLEKGLIAGNVAVIIGMAFWSLRRKSWMQSILILVQAGLFGWYLWKSGGDGGSGSFVLDRLSGLMLLLTNGTGAIILLFAMKIMSLSDSGHSRKISRQSLFFAAASLLLSAMNGLILANNLLWILFFWQAAVVGAVLMIAHDFTPLSIKNAQKFSVLCSLGGVALLAGIVLIFSASGTLQISQILMIKEAAALLAPISCFVVAGMVFCSLFPFQNALLRSSASPAQVSAMLQSSTIVTAGVYLIFRLSPLFLNTWLGKMVAVLGAFSFAAAALLAAMNNDSKRILTFTTISVNGLAVAMACLPSIQAIFAAVLLVLIHGVTKSLLILSSRSRTHSMIPFRLSLLGGISMLMPPFGVPMAQWTALEYSIGEPVVMALIAAGILFSMIIWTRFTGRCLKPDISSRNGGRLSSLSFAPEIGLAFGMVALSALYIPFTNIFVIRILKDNYGRFADISQGDVNRFIVRDISGVDPLWIFGVIIVTVALGRIVMHSCVSRMATDNSTISLSDDTIPYDRDQKNDIMTRNEDETGLVFPMPADDSPSEVEDFVSMEIEVDTEEIEEINEELQHFQTDESPKEGMNPEKLESLEDMEGLEDKTFSVVYNSHTSFQRIVFSSFPSAGKTNLIATVFAGGLVILMLEVVFR